MFGNKNPNEPMGGMKRTYEFHWVQSFEKHSKAHIKNCSYKEFDSLAYGYKESKTLDGCVVNCCKF